jgi:predicted ATPase with chaperone activity
MRLEEVFVAKGILQPADLARALDGPPRPGIAVTDRLLALELITPEQIDSVLQTRPQAGPASVAETGVSPALLLALLLKALQRGVDDLPGLVDLLRLPGHVVTALLDEAVARKLVKVSGAEARSTIPVLNYALTPAGRTAAAEAAERNGYLGPAPVGLEAYAGQMRRQALGNESIEAAGIKAAFAGLVLADEFVDRVGPAINAGRAILFYGPPGNGKSSLAKRIGRVFTDIVYLPYCIEVEGQIVRLFDPQIHEEIARAGEREATATSIRQGDFDRRWVACRRPVVITGGEFTLDMLELRPIAGAGFYEAPLHIKAVGGTFVIDDFGRQLVKPKDLLNRWMIPLEERVDYLKLETGATFALPFDELVVFCTNLAPDDLMDAAFLRRIPYKIKVGPPALERFGDIFRRAAAARDLPVPEPILDWLVEELQGRRHVPLGCYQPRFIVDHIMEACRFARRPPEITAQLVEAALDNLHTSEG